MYKNILELKEFFGKTKNLVNWPWYEIFFTENAIFCNASTCKCNARTQCKCNASTFNADSEYGVEILIRFLKLVSKW